VANSTSSSASKTGKPLCDRPLPNWALALAKRAQENKLTELDLLWTQPSKIFQAGGLEAYPWQKELLESRRDKIIILCCRQSGKSLACSAMALRTMLTRPPALVLVVSPSDRQSSEFLLKVKIFYYSLHLKGLPKVTSDAKLQFFLDNGSRLIGLPDSEGKIRGFSDVNLLFFEEASRVPDNLYYTCTPMLAASRGRQVALSTAFGRQGWYFDTWDHDQAWERFNVTADKCPHFTPQFLAEEKRKMPERWYLQEYFNAFLDPLDSVFRQEDIERMVNPTLTSELSW
jgi:hypothetical protein